VKQVTPRGHIIVGIVVAILAMLLLWAYVGDEVFYLLQAPR
jgi:hypothetical protein